METLGRPNLAAKVVEEIDKIEAEIKETSRPTRNRRGGTRMGAMAKPAKQTA